MPEDEKVTDSMFDKAEEDFALRQDKNAYSKLNKELAKALLFQTVAGAFISNKKMMQIHRITDRISEERRWRA